jgi:serine phosphatase RsbU (regulator of sigma subunit)
VAAAPSGEVFEEEHLRRSLSSTYGQPAAEVVKRVLDDVHRFTGRDDFADDLELVAVSVRAE